MKQIEAINLIQNVGRFRDCHCPSNQFKKETIIYGRNTQGKSTLTSIFRSMKTGEPEILEGRKTFGSTNAQKTEIRLNGETGREIRVFPSERWNLGENDILIFDNEFITKNVFEGERITYDQYRNMNNIIIGQKGIDLSLQIYSIQGKLDDDARKKRDLTKRYKELVPNHYSDTITLEQFCQIKSINNVEKQISDYSTQLANIGKSKEILSAVNNSISELEVVDFSEIVSTLQKTIDFNPTKVENHIIKHWNNPQASKEFLRIGMNLTKEPLESCVFCGQSLGEKEIELLKDFAQFFKGEYQELQKQINKISEKLRKWNVEKIFATLEYNKERYGLDIDLGLRDDIIKLKDIVAGLIENKYSDIFAAPDVSKIESNLGSFTKLVESLKEQLLKYDKNAITIERRDIEEKLTFLEINKLRSNVEIVALCDDYIASNRESETNRVQREILRKELDDYSASIMQVYKTTINNKLLELGADYQIEEMTQLRKLVGDDERLYTLVFYKNYKISMDGEIENVPNFKNCLSESDKRILAFAFFMALLENDNKLDEKVVVFDDPFSSFDEERKRRTIIMLKDICAYRNGENGQRVKIVPLQKIILTHERGFYREIYLKEFPEALTLILVTNPASDAVKSSSIEYCDVESEFPDDEIIASIKKIKDILNNNKYYEPYESDCRIVMENILKRKYYYRLQEELRQRKSIRTFVTKLKDNYKQDDFDGLIRLCDDLNIELHDTSLYKSDGDHESILKDFFKYIEIL